MGVVRGSLTLFGSVGFRLLRGLGLVDGLEELCVDALGAKFLSRAEDAGAQLGVVGLFAACSCGFGHCDGWLWVGVWVDGWV